MLLDGKILSEKIKDEISSSINSNLIKPCLAVIQIGDDEAINIYIKAKKKACDEVGIYFKHIKFNDSVKEREIANKIIELNNDEYVNGIIIQLPIPEKYDEYKLLNLIDKNKDIDGHSDANIGKLFKGKNNLVPCTSIGVIEILKEYGIEIAGKHAVVVGRSDSIGKPLAMLLLQNDATVTICHAKTNDLSKYTKEADILISAVGKKDIINIDMVKDGAVVIDVGISRNEGKVCGDVAKDVIIKASYITPVPGGVGPMTVAMLLKNVLLNYQKNNLK